MEPYVDALIREANQQKPFFPEKVETVYLGGGTPSLLPEALLSRLVQGIGEVFSLDDVAEFTAEANPGTVSVSWVRTAATLGVTRFSFGMQAYSEKDLNTLGRIHGYRDVCEAVSLARDAGADVNLDLIFGIPGQTLPDWRRTLEKALELSPDHISAYGLIPEPNTEMDRRLQSGEWELPDPDVERAMYDLAIRLLAESGLKQYEISNFAKPGKECRHNIGYWSQIPYLGLGLAAASMTPPMKAGAGVTYQRLTNPDTFEDYFRLVSGPDSSLRTVETVSPPEARFETMMLGLRMAEGIREDRFASLHGISLQQAYGNKLEQFVRDGFLLWEDGVLRLTRKGMDFQNQVLVDLMP